MIKLKDKINKAATLRELKQIAKSRYKEYWQPELREDAFIDGAKALLKLLHIGGVVGQSEQLVCPKCDGKNIDPTFYTDGYGCNDCGEYWAK